KTFIAEHERRMAATIVKLNPLTDAIRSGAEDHDLAFAGGRCLILLLVSRIEVRREGFELGTAGIHSFVNRSDSELLAVISYFVFSRVSQIGQTPIGQCSFLKHAQQFRRNLLEILALNFTLNLHHLLELLQEPRIDSREPVNFVN